MLYVNGVAITSINGIGLTSVTFVDATGSTVVWTTPATYNPLVNYEWSDTFAQNGVMQLTNIGTSGINATMKSGSGVLFNGDNQDITTNYAHQYDKGNISFTFKLDTVNADQNFLGAYDSNVHNLYMGMADSGEFSVGIGDKTWNQFHFFTPLADTLYNISLNFGSGSFTLTVNNTDTYNGTYSNDTISSVEMLIGSLAGFSGLKLNGTMKDIYIFSDNLTPSEIAKYSNDPNGFFENVRSGIIDNCTLNMPLDGSDATVHDYQNNVDYTIANYTAGVRGFYQTELDYGTQEFNFIKDGLWRGALSSYLECQDRGAIDTGVVINDGVAKQIEMVIYLDKTSISETVQFGSSDGGQFQLQTNGNFFYIGEDSRAFTASYPIGYTHVLVDIDATGAVTAMTLNGSIRASVETTTATDNGNTFFFGRVNDDWFNWNTTIRLFKIHTETQDAQTLYNLAVNAGLLEGNTTPTSETYINYDWSNTLVNNNKVEITNTGSSASNAIMYSGQAPLFNGDNQYITTNYTQQTEKGNITFSFSLATVESVVNFIGVYNSDVNNLHIGVNNNTKLGVAIGEVNWMDNSLFTPTVDTLYTVSLNFDNGNYTLYVNNTVEFTGTYSNSVISDMTFLIGSLYGASSLAINGIMKDVYIFSDTLTPNEIDKYSTDPNGFFEDTRSGIINNCILNMPLEGTGSVVHDYQNNVDYTIGNYTSSVRDTTLELNYGSQEINFLRNGTLRGALSQYFEWTNGYADTQYIPGGVFQIEEVTGLNGVYTHKVYNSDGSKYTNGSSDGTYTIPTTNILLNNTDIDTSSIDEILLFKLYDVIQDETTLYNDAAYAGLLNVASNLVDTNGIEVVDANGNYIILKEG